MGNTFGKLQKLGKALMLPIAVLPAASLLLRLGAPDVFNLRFIGMSGAAIFDNLPLLFAIGVAVGLAKDNNGAAGLAGAIGYLVLTRSACVINETINMSVLGGMISGVVAGLCYNKWHKIKLPDFLAFFGGRRFIPIVTAFYSIILAFVCGHVWPIIQMGIDAVGNWVINLEETGVFFFGFFNRLLIPVGLHHVLNNIVWFVFGEYQGAVGDLHRFFAGDPSAGIFMAGFYPVMMFGLPAAALAMYTTAKKENRAVVGGALLSVAFTAFLTGITEPIEFMFMFLAPVLYIAHAVLTGLSLAVCCALGIHHGFGFSAGLIDFGLSMKLATHGWWLIPIGLIFGVVYYLLFVIIIKKFDLATPGRMDEESEAVSVLIKQNGMDEIANMYIEKLGGKENIEDVDYCITRLRLTLKDSSIVNDQELKALGAVGVLRPTKKNMQVVVGTQAELIANQIKTLL